MKGGFSVSDDIYIRLYHPLRRLKLIYTGIILLSKISQEPPEVLD
jgi:hypothetical protein